MIYSEDPKDLTASGKIRTHYKVQQRQRSRSHIKCDSVLSACRQVGTQRLGRNEILTFTHYNNINIAWKHESSRAWACCCCVAVFKRLT